MHIRHLLLASLGATVLPCAAQERATCLFSEGFDGPGIPAGWQIGAQVEQLDADGNGLGTFVDAWRVENATTTNNGVVIHVPDVPAGNSFAVANDDASPCNCDMQDVVLTSPSIDLSGLTHAVVSFNAFNDGLFGGGNAFLEASADGNAWSTVLEVPEVAGAWQHLVASLDTYVGAPVTLRFRWSDNGLWATGFAIDEVCLSSPNAQDISLLRATLGDPTTSAYVDDVRSLGYTQMPLEQAGPLMLGLRVRNNGFNALSNVHAHVSITLNATQIELDTLFATELTPLSERTIGWNTGWIAGEVGDVQVAFTLTHDNADGDPADDAATLNYRITGAGEGSPMAIDNDQPETMVGGSGDLFSLADRFELIAGSTVQGIGARLGSGTTAGTTVHFLLLDGQLGVLGTSAEHTITEEDLALCFAGGLLYLPLEEPVSIDQPHDVFALVRMDVGSLFLAAGGPAVLGSVVKVNSDLTLDLLENTPIIRPFLATPVTGMAEEQLTNASLTVWPNPATTHIQVSSGGSPVDYEVWDSIGRLMYRGHAGTADVSTWPTGTYTVRVRTRDALSVGRLMVVR